MNRRQFLGTSAVAGAGLLAAGTASGQLKSGRHGRGGTMKAGFARESITPPIGTKMMGFGGRDMEKGCTGVHDDIYVRALFLEHKGEQAVILTYDLCFIGREEADRYKGAIGRVMDLLPRQILMNTSHNHVGPSVGNWYSAGYEIPERHYLDLLERATVRAVTQARDAMRDVTVSAGVTRSKLPVNRRRRMPDGKTENRPNPTGFAYEKLPVCLLKDADGSPVCLLFSISCHPSMISGWEISAEYPGAATSKIDEALGCTAAMFLQGVGGDAKPLVIGRDGAEVWAPGTWELVDEAGGIVASETLDLMNSGLTPIKPQLAIAATEMVWPLEPAPPREYFQAILDGAAPEKLKTDVYCMWAAYMISLLDRGEPLPDSIPLTLHGLTLGKGLRITGIEGEATAPWGTLIESFYGDGVTFPLGYCDGQGLYLPVTEMLPEGGYEVDSFWEYRLPSRLAPRMEDHVRNGLEILRQQGVV